MVFTKYKLNEDKQYNKRAQSKLNKESEVRMIMNITQFFTPKSELPRLDRSSPPDIAPELFEQMAEQSSSSAFTITYKKCLQDNLDELGLRKYLINTLSTISFNENIPFEIALIPDVDADGNFHYHGCIKQPLKYRPRFKKLMTAYNGFIKYKYIQDIEGWKNYCYKRGQDHKGRQREPVYSIDEIRKYAIYMRVQQNF